MALDEEANHGAKVLEADVWLHDQAQKALEAARFAKLVQLGDEKGRFAGVALGREDSLPLGLDHGHVALILDLVGAVATRAT